MKGVDIEKEPREGGTEFGKINMKAYTQQHFGMFSGEQKTVSLRFTNNLLDTMVIELGNQLPQIFIGKEDLRLTVVLQLPNLSHGIFADNIVPFQPVEKHSQITIVETI